MIGTPSQYTPSKLVGTKSPANLESGSYFMNIKEGKKIVGSLYVKKYNDSYIIRDVFVLEQERGKGYGKKLMEDILAFLSPKKKDIFLYVDPSNTALILYKKLGFKLIKKGAAFGDKYQYIK
jgi:ribosomal protein S18 acetylase RimI-like enzyme